MLKTPPKRGITAFALHIIAMAFMLCDHIWATVATGADWLTCLGRIAFPIFAFMVAEGYCRTANFKRYMLRLFVFALISEIPFNLMYGGSLFYPFHQNVLWTFLMALLCIKAVDSTKKQNKPWLTLLCAVAAAFMGFLFGTVLMVDYYGFGVVTVLLFYVFRGKKPWQVCCQAVGLFIINCLLLGGRVMPLNIFGIGFDFPQQGFALLALIPILLYNGEKGKSNKLIKFGFYAFYPLHMLVLALIALLG